LFGRQTLAAGIWFRQPDVWVVVFAKCEGEKRFGGTEYRFSPSKRRLQRAGSVGASGKPVRGGRFATIKLRRKKKVPRQPEIFLARENGTNFAAAGFFDERSALHSRRKDTDMNWNQVEGNWEQFKGSAQKQWGKLTGDDLDVIAGNRKQLAGKLQERYGKAQEEADREIDTWLSRH
jgi:uncharacterized protein YjbJ (UPF0337 family)